MCEGHDVIETLTQRRYGDDIESQPVQQVLAERPAGSQCLQVGIRRTDNADVNSQCVAATDPLNFAVLDDAQDFLLHPQRDRGEFVENQRAAVGTLEMTDMGTLRPGERAGLVTE